MSPGPNARASAENVHNRNPSLVALGKNCQKNGRKSGKGKKNRKSKGNQKKMEKNGNKKGIRKNQNRMNTADARTTCLSTTCVDTAVAAMKLLKDKVDNFEKQEKRISKKSNIGAKKSAKKDVFGPTLQRLSDAAGGNLSGKQGN